MSPVAQASVAAAVDPREAAFCAPNAAEVFHSVVHLNNVWKADPLDVEQIHAEARDTFARLFHRAGSIPSPEFGKSLLLLGRGGSGKTHLMRAFRQFTHERGGYCGYLQMISQAEDYARYVLSYLIDALHHPYLDPANPTPALTRLARGLLDSIQIATAEEKRRFCEDTLEPEQTSQEVFQLADFALQEGRFDDRDLDLLRALLFLLPNDRRLRARVMMWLRCQNLPPADCALLGGLVPRTEDSAALNMIAGLGRVMAAVQQAPLVILVDQLEGTFDQSLDTQESGRRFRQAVDTLVNISSIIPTSIVVVACLEDHFHASRQHLSGPKLDRLLRDPQPISLRANREVAEIEQLLTQRLHVLYSSQEVDFRQEDPLYPFPRPPLAALAGKTTRDVLDFFHQHHERCMLAGRWIPIEPGETAEPAPPAPPSSVFAQLWSDFLAEFPASDLDDETQVANLLSWTIEAVSGEMPRNIHFAASADGRFIEVEIQQPGNAVDKLLVAICDRGSQGGGLSRQVTEVARRAGEIPVALVRSSPFPNDPKSQTAKAIAGLLAPKGKGRRVEVQNGDWRAMAAFLEFHSRHHSRPEFVSWLRESRPLSRLPALCCLLAFDKLLAAPEEKGIKGPHFSRFPAQPPSLKVPPIFRSALVAMDEPMILGTGRGTTDPIRVLPRELIQHAAFLGGSGSGKTTAALTLIEQLIRRGIPAVLVDRKGDLCRYADPSAWAEPEDDSARIVQRRELQEQLDVAIYTPGNPSGRSLTIPIVPSDLRGLPVAEQEQIAGQAASALGAMMGYRTRGVEPKVAILSKAIEILAASADPVVTLPRLKQMVEEQDDALLMAVNGFDAKSYKKLADDLLTLYLSRKSLLDTSSGQVLDIDALLGRGIHAQPGKTRLSVISTQFLGDNAAIDFWLSQMLTTLDRWRTKNPAEEGRLQAVFLFDEADLYLPAMRQPATKAPLESLLRRARSAGIGLFLATQSPGDLDYRCRDQIRTWVIGRVKEPVALKKLDPMLEAGRGDVASRLPSQRTGQFYLVREKEVVPIQVTPSLVRTSQLSESRIAALACARVRDSRQSPSEAEE